MTEDEVYHAASQADREKAAEIAEREGIIGHATHSPEALFVPLLEAIQYGRAETLREIAGRLRERAEDPDEMVSPLAYAEMVNLADELEKEP